MDKIEKSSLDNSMHYINDSLDISNKCYSELLDQGEKLKNISDITSDISMKLETSDQVINDMQCCVFFKKNNRSRKQKNISPVAILPKRVEIPVESERKNGFDNKINIIYNGIKELKTNSIYIGNELDRQEPILNDIHDKLKSTTNQYNLQINKISKIN